VLRPVNRYITIEIPAPSNSQESLIVLPEDYKAPVEAYIEVRALEAAKDVRFSIQESNRLIVDRYMIEEITIGGTIYNVILDNYVVGMIE